MRLPENHKYKSAQQENQSSFPNRKKKARATFKKQRSATVNSHENFLARFTVGLYLRSS